MFDQDKYETISEWNLSVGFLLLAKWTVQLMRQHFSYLSVLPYFMHSSYRLVCLLNGDSVSRLRIPSFFYCIVAALIFSTVLINIFLDSVDAFCC